MKITGILKHIAIVILLFGVIIGLPAAKYLELPSDDGGVDAVSQASLVLPDSPSGEYYVLINTRLHEDSMDDWRSFFCDSDFVVIFEDIKCIVARGDASGRQLAERFQAQLPENQMVVRDEDPTLLISKAEQGYIDVAVFSAEMADALGFNEKSLSGVELIKVSGGDKDAEA